MESNFNTLAKQLYKKLHSQFRRVKIADEFAEVLSKKQDIPLARFFEVEYQERGAPYGTISINLDQEDGIVVQLSGDLLNDQNNSIKNLLYNFVRSLRQFSRRHLVNFTVRNLGKRNLDQRDYSFQAKRKEPDNMPPIMENKLYGTSRISYQNLGEARLIIKHSQQINDDYAAGRSQHIQHIYIENAQGERFKYPLKHLNGARALAEHINHGGTPYDAIGKHIVGLSEELAQLRKFKNYVNRQEQLSEAIGTVADRVVERIGTIKKQIDQLQKPAFYTQFSESFVESHPQSVPEHLINDWIDRLTIRTFNEDLKTVFPYLYNLLDESELPVKKLTPEDILTTESSGVNYQKSCSSSINELDHFERVIESITNSTGIFSSDPRAQQAAIEKLNQLMSDELLAGPDGINVRNSLIDIIDDPEFLDSLRDIDPQLDARSLIQGYVLRTDPELASKINISSSEKPSNQAEPTPTSQTTAPAELDAQPPTDTTQQDQSNNNVKESWGSLSRDFKSRTRPKFSLSGQRKRNMRKMLKKAQRAGATLETTMDVNFNPYTLQEIIDECGFTAEECGFAQKNGVDEILEFIEGFWNEQKQNFTIGGTRVKTKVAKEFEDGRFKSAGPEDVRRVYEIIDQRDPSSNEHNRIMRLSKIPQISIDNRTAELEEVIADMRESASDSMKRLINKINLRD